MRTEQQGGSAGANRHRTSACRNFRPRQNCSRRGKLTEARAALTAFIEKYPSGPHSRKRRTCFGEVNIRDPAFEYPSPEKQEYIVKSGDVLAQGRAQDENDARVDHAHEQSERHHAPHRRASAHFASRIFLFIQRKPKLVVLLDHGAFFKRYHVREVKLPGARARKLARTSPSDGVEGLANASGSGPKNTSAARAGFGWRAGGYISIRCRTARIRRLCLPPPQGSRTRRRRDLDELSSLVNNKTAVTITIDREAKIGH